MRRVLALPRYRSVLFAYTANELAWIVSLLTVAVVVYRRTGSALGTTAYFLCSQFLPALVAPAFVARLEQQPTRVVLAALFAAQGAVAAVLGLVADKVPLGPLLVIVTLAGLGALITRVFNRVAMLSVTTPAGLLREGNAVANAAFTVTIFVGPLVGGLVTALGSARMALFGDAVLLAAAAAIVLFTLHVPAVTAKERPPARRRVRAAIAYASRHRQIRLLLPLQAIALLFFTISLPVEIVLVQHSLHRGAGAYGALLSSWGGGAIVGSAIYVRWRMLPARQTIAVGAGALGIGFLVMATAPTIAVAIVGAALGGIGNGSEAVAVRTVLQEQVEEQWMAMVMSLNDSISQSVPGAGILLGGGIAVLAGPRVALAVAGIGALVVTAVAWVMVRPGSEQRPGLEPDGPAGDLSDRDRAGPGLSGGDGAGPELSDRDRERGLRSRGAHPG